MPALIGLVLCLRFVYFYMTAGGGGHLQSLILAAILLIISFLLFSLGVLADLIRVNRELNQETHFLLRKLMYRRENPKH